VIGTIATVAIVTAVAKDIPPLSRLQVTTYGQASTVYDAGGRVLGYIKGTILRQPVAERDQPVFLREATVAIEDHGYYQHGAVDYLSLVRAALADLVSGHSVQGGSTITMQLVRNIYPAVGDAKTFMRKIKEAIVANRFEKHHSKAWILTDYLNTVPYGTVDGQTAEGVQAASWMFFDHPAWKDTLAQSALLAGLPQAPSDYNPFTNPHAARERRNTVLAAMARYGYITPAAAARAQAEGLGLVPNRYAASLRSSWFLDFIQRELTAHYGPQVLSSGDLKIYTTIDPHLGALAKNAISSVLNLPTDPSAALVSENPANGYVDTMAQSGSYSQSQYSLATQAERQPGSTFKAIVLADALAHGIDPFTTDYLSHTLPAGWLPVAPSYTVHIDSGANLDAPLNLDTALVQSDNTVFAQLAADLGEASVTQMAYAMGVIPGTLHDFPAEALGGLERGVTPLEMANVYATIADGGWRNKQITIRKVVFPDGRVDASWGVPHRTKVLSTAAATVETEILQHNVQYGTATLSAIGCPTAAKTGTTSGLVDAWLDGFTPNRATVVWMGYPKANISMTDVHGQAQFGGLLPAQIWHDFMSAVVTPPCTPLPDPNANPMTYVPFTGHYQQLGLASYVPPSTGPSGTTGTGGATAPSGGGRHHKTDATPATTTPATTTPSGGGGAAAPPATTGH
jgi:penicillin-binding protein 1A